jgi:hypothetical protein
VADVLVNGTQVGKTTGKDSVFWKAISNYAFDSKLKIGLFSGDYAESDGEISTCARCGDDFLSAIRHFDPAKRFCPFCAGFGKLMVVELEELRASPPWPGEDPRSW